MQSATQSTLTNLVEQHVTSLIRESAVVNRHSKRCGTISAASSSGDDDAPTHNNNKKRRLIHHDDVNLALAWRGSEKLYVSGGVPLSAIITPPDSGDDDGEGGESNTLNNKVNNNNAGSVPRVDLNAYLQSEMTIKPPNEINMTLHWLAVDGVMPMIPMNDVWNYTAEGGSGRGGQYQGNDIVPVLELDADINNTTSKSREEESIRIRELQHRLLSEELQLYYQRVTSTINNPYSTNTEINTILMGITNDVGIQEIIPFLSRFIASGLMLSSSSSSSKKKNTAKHNGSIAYCRKLVQVFNAMLSNKHVHLDLFLHQLISPLGTCIVVKKISSNNDDDDEQQHWALREEAARTLVKACNLYGGQYTTLRPRIIKLLTQQALRVDRPLVTQYGGIVGITNFGPRAIDAFILPLVGTYWERWEDELILVSSSSISGDGGGKKRDMVRENELQMCQQALLNAMQVFVQNVTPGEQSQRVDVEMFSNVFGERLIPMQTTAANGVSEYMSCVV